MLNGDKLVHAITGAFVVLVFALSGWPRVGLWACLLVAAGKEAWDRRHPLTHTADGLDLLATVLGGLFAGQFFTLFWR